MINDEMDDDLWRFVDASGDWARQFGMTRMAGRVLGWLLVCDPAEQTAAQLADAMRASKGSISGATGSLVRAGLVDRLHIRGERADRFRLRPAGVGRAGGRPGHGEARAADRHRAEGAGRDLALRRARLEELDAFYAFWQSRVATVGAEWRDLQASEIRRWCG